MKEIKVYTWTICPYCVRAKNLLSDKGLSYVEINLDGKDDEMKALRNKTGMRTVPQIFIGDHFVGGYSELSTIEKSGELDKLLK